MVLTAIFFLGFAICIAAATGVSRRLVVSSECEAFGRVWTKAVLSEYDVHLLEDYSIMAYFGNDEEVSRKLDSYLSYSAAGKLDAAITGANADLTGYELGNPDNFREALRLGFTSSAASELFFSNCLVSRDFFRPFLRHFRISEAYLSRTWRMIPLRLKTWSKKRFPGLPRFRKFLLPSFSLAAYTLVNRDTSWEPSSSQIPALSKPGFFHCKAGRKIGDQLICRFSVGAVAVVVYAGIFRIQPACRPVPPACTADKRIPPDFRNKCLIPLLLGFLLDSFPESPVVRPVFASLPGRTAAFHKHEWLPNPFRHQPDSFKLAGQILDGIIAGR